MIFNKPRKLMILLASNNLKLWRKRTDYTNGYILYRRSKIHEAEKHWNETRLGEISVNWSYISNRKSNVLLNQKNDETLYSETFKRVLIFDTNKYKEEELPPRKIVDSSGNFLNVCIDHDPLPLNYSHCNINSYLTTSDGNFERNLVTAGDYNKHPLKKKLRALRNEYKTLLAYWFQDYYDIV